MKKHYYYIIILICLNFNFVIAQNTENKISNKYSEGYAYIPVMSAHIHLYDDFKSDFIYRDYILLIPLKKLHKKVKRQIKRDKKRETNKEYYQKRQEYLYSLEKSIEQKQSFYLSSKDHSHIFELMGKWYLKEFISKKDIIILTKTPDNELKKVRYSTTRIGDWSYAKVQKEKTHFAIVRKTRATGSIYSSCYNGRTTILGYCIMGVQKIIYKLK
jgi:hypothetical protein